MQNLAFPPTRALEELHKNNSSSLKISQISSTRTGDQQEFSGGEMPDVEHKRNDPWRLVV
jgi:hypothetical protein